MFNPCVEPLAGRDWLRFVEVLIPQLCILAVALLTYVSSRKNRGDIKDVKRTLNGKDVSLSSDVKKVE